MARRVVVQVALVGLLWVVRPVGLVRLVSLNFNVIDITLNRQTYGAHYLSCCEC